MKIKTLAWVLGGLFLALAFGAIRSQENPKPVIDPEADLVLRQMSERMAKVPAAIFRVTDTIDDVQADGRKLQFAHIRQLTVMRPDKLKAEVSGDVTNRTVWLDGKTLTVWDRDKKVYAQLEVPGSIDQALDMLQDKYGMSLPGADLLSTNVYKIMTEGCREVNYIGLGFVGEEKCHHLAFTRDNIDWQLWVSLGDKPAPRKLLITYKQLPGEPQYTMQLLKMDDPEKIKSSIFTSEIPKGVEKIEFHPVANAQ